MYRAFAEGKTLPVALACVSVSLAVSYVTTLALSPFIRRGYQSKGELPLVCLAILLCVFSCSLSWFSAHYLVLLPICFLSGKTVGKTGAIVCAIAIGLGQAFFSLSVVFLSFAVFSV